MLREAVLPIFAEAKEGDGSRWDSNPRSEDETGKLMISDSTIGKCAKFNHMIFYANRNQLSDCIKYRSGLAVFQSLLKQKREMAAVGFETPRLRREGCL
ncbi:hypothetical protein HNY73_012182 [Argiope bruennichi]|uniref:Uncharacterized protein n=1 Tax=Argiope bruennichi TaxID=94029 RepID=A0A8T0EYW5_ARGBR|nr:hypothetical protein HNY73_012182 [Argiope bruennichi]